MCNREYIHSKNNEPVSLIRTDEIKATEAENTRERGLSRCDLSDGFRRASKIEIAHDEQGRETIAEEVDELHEGVHRQATTVARLTASRATMKICSTIQRSISLMLCFMTK